MIMPYKGTLCNINTIKTVEQFVTSIKSYSILYLQRWKFFHNHHQPHDDPARLVLLGARHGISNNHHNDVRWGNSVKYPEVKGVINLEGGGISFLQMQSFMVPYIDICNLDRTGHVIWVLWVSRSWYEFSVWYDYQNPDTDMALGMAMAQSLTVISNWK